MDLSNIKLFSGGSCPGLAEGISKHLNIPLSRVDIKPFADGERFVKLEENVREKNVFIIQSTQPPDSNWMQLWVMIDAAKRASAKKITAVIPYYGYARQERKKEGRVPITAALVAKFTEVAGANRIVSLELHTSAIQGFFNGPFDHLYAYPVWVEVINDIYKEKDAPIALVSTDINGGKVIRSYQQKHFPNAKIVIVDKERTAHGESKVVDVYGNPSGCICFILDDMIAGGGSIINTSDAILARGALEIHAIATHPLFFVLKNQDEVVTKLQNSSIKSIHVGDTIPTPFPLKTEQKIQVHSFTKLFSDAIREIATGGSVSKVCFEER